jgi:DNA-binding MurR/RpiR family transcriptional regulator
VEAAAAFYATMDEIAAVLEVSTATVKRAARTLEFQEAYERGRAKCRYTLRRMQVELAESGNATMQIWLGKQILGQRDNVHVKQESVVQMQGTTSAADILQERLDALANRLNESDPGNE